MCYISHGTYSDAGLSLNKSRSERGKMSAERADYHY